MANVTTTAFGLAAVDCVGRIIDTQRSDGPLSPAVVICPSSFVAVGLRRALGRRPAGIAGVAIISIDEFLNQLAGRGLARIGGHRANKLEVQAMIGAELRRNPGRFQQVARHRATQERLVRLHHQLSGIGVEARARLAAQATGLAADAVGVVGAVMDSNNSARNGDQIVDLALEELERQPVGSGGPIVVYLPEPVRPAQGRLITEIARRSDSHIVVGLTGDPHIDDRHRGRLAGWSIHVNRDHLIEPPQAKRVQVGDPGDEVRVAVGDIVAHAALGVPLSAMAVLYSVSDPYESLLAEQLDAAGIPWGGPGRRPLSHSVTGRFLTRMLDLAVNGLDRARVMTLVAAAPVGDDQGLVPGPRWDEIAKRAGVIDQDHWEPRLQSLADQLGRDAERANPVEGGSAEETELELIERFLAFLKRLTADLTPPPEPASWLRWSRWLIDLIHSYLGSGESWPSVEQQGREMVIGVLEGLASLEPFEPEPCLATFGSMLASQLDESRVFGRVSGHGLMVAPINTAVGLEFERVVAVGLAEGVFPRNHRDDSILPDRFRGAAGGMLLPSGSATEIDVRAVAAVLAASRTQPVVTTARGDLRSSRSLGWPRELDRLVIPETRVLESHLQVLVDHGRPPSRSALRLRALVNHVLGGDPVHTHQLAHSDRALAATLARGLDRRRGDLNRHTGLVRAGLIDAEERLLSPTALEDYAACPRSYLLGRVLRIGDEDRPQRSGEISPLDRGSLVHEILERFMAQCLEAGTVPKPNQSWSPHQVEQLHQIADTEIKAAAARGQTGGRVNTTILGRQIHSEMDLFVNTDNRFRAELGSTPRHVELGFGFVEEPRTVTLADGRSIRLRGRVDRVDTTADGGLVVIDYKGGSARQFAKLDANPLDGGRRLQLALYTLVLAEMLGVKGERRALYWLTKHGLYKPVDVEHGLEGDLDQAVSAVLDGISGGMFPGIPGPVVGWPRTSFVNCRYCEFDPICPTDRQREWDAMRQDDGLKPIAVLIEAQGER